MRILTLFLALFLTWLPESVTYVDYSQTQEACWEDVDDTEEEAVIRTVLRQQRLATVSSRPLCPGFPCCLVDIALTHPVFSCFERQWLLHCRLRL